MCLSRLSVCLLYVGLASIYGRQFTFATDKSDVIVESAEGPLSESTRLYTCMTAILASLHHYL